jgi:hypothetical protein
VARYVTEYRPSGSGDSSRGRRQSVVSHPRPLSAGAPLIDLGVWRNGPSLAIVRPGGRRCRPVDLRAADRRGWPGGVVSSTRRTSP